MPRHTIFVHFSTDNQQAIDSLAVSIAQLAPYVVDNVTVMCESWDDPHGKAVEYKSLDFTAKDA